MPDWKSILGGTPARTEQQSVLSQPQQGLQNQAIQQLMSMLGQGGQGGGSFEPIEQQARQGFAQKTIPMLSERFAGLGQSGAGLSSPAYGSQLYGAGQDFEQGLAALKSQHQTNQFGQLSNLAMQNSTQNNYIPRQPGIPEQLLPGIAALAPTIGSAFGPIGTGIGAGIGGLAKLVQWMANRNQQEPMQQQSPESIPQSYQQQTASRIGNYEQNAMNPNVNQLAQAVPQQGGVPQGINLGTYHQLNQPQGLNYAGQPYDRQTILQHQQQNFDRQLIDTVSMGLPQLMKDIGEGTRYKTQTA
jgi:hypothetical protein